MQWNGWASAKKTLKYAQRSPSKRQQYLQALRTRVKRYGSQSLVYVDESGFDAHSLRPHGYAKIAQRVYGNCHGGYRKRTSLVLAKCGSRHFGAMLFEGACNTQVFVTWIKQVLLSELTPNQTVIIDNACFHKSVQVRELIESVGCQLLYLPPYSPDFNPIEQSFAWLKKLRYKLRDTLTLDQLVCEIL